MSYDPAPALTSDDPAVLQLLSPELSAADLARLAAYGDERPVDAGEVLFQPGDLEFDFFVILDGDVTVLALSLIHI